MTTPLRRLFIPHREAERLLDLVHDRALGDEGPGPEAEDWLEGHLGGCARCRASAEARRAYRDVLGALPAPRAPDGFAGRVLLAAATRRVAVEAPPPAGGWRPELALAGLALAGAALVVLRPGPELPGGEVEVAGGRAPVVASAPHLVVRPVGLGAAQARARILAILSAHGAEVGAEAGDVVAVLPRAALVPVVQALASEGRFEVTRAKEALDPSVQRVRVRFELE
jgi:hypothetical protein